MRNLCKDSSDSAESCDFNILYRLPRGYASRNDEKKAILRKIPQNLEILSLGRFHIKATLCPLTVFARLCKSRSNPFYALRSGARKGCTLCGFNKNRLPRIARRFSQWREKGNFTQDSIESRNDGKRQLHRIHNDDFMAILRKIAESYTLYNNPTQSQQFNTPPPFRIAHTIHFRTLLEISNIAHI